MVALGQLYLAAGGTKYLAAAEQVFGWAEACTPGAFEDLTAAKVGWGAAVLYAATGMDRYAERAPHRQWHADRYANPRGSLAAPTRGYTACRPGCRHVARYQPGEGLLAN